jgi:hypothetical protein
VISNSKLAKDLPAIVEHMVKKGKAGLQEEQDEDDAEDE